MVPIVAPLKLCRRALGIPPAGDVRPQFTRNTRRAHLAAAFGINSRYARRPGWGDRRFVRRREWTALENASFLSGII